MAAVPYGFRAIGCLCVGLLLYALGVAATVYLPSRGLVVFLLIVAGAGVGLIGYAWERRRRRPLERRARGQCDRCGYDLRGSESGVCLECGLGTPRPRALAKKGLNHALGLHR